MGALIVQRMVRGDCLPVLRSMSAANADVDSHPATYPVELAERCLRRVDVPPYCLVLDPFAGIGSTLIAAKKYGMDAVCIEIDPAYVAAARHRLGLEMLDAAQ
jgi:site-specific DNA-methyltransferase (adenine-specific)